MSTLFDHQLCIAVPNTPELLAIAQAVAAAIDPDSGGARSFDAVRAIDATLVTDPETGAVISATPIEGGQIWAIAHSPCTADTAAGLPYLHAVPGMLYDRVLADYAARRPNETPPTLADCETLRTAIRYTVDLGLDASLHAMGLVRWAETPGPADWGPT